MATNYISKKLSLFVAEQFNESFFEPEPTSVGYVFVGKTTNYTEEPEPDIIEETDYTEKGVWGNIFAAKKITGSDINLVIQKNQWSGGITYNQYDDRVPTYDVSDNFYVVNESDEVYKCLSNNYGSLSSIQPFGNYSINNGIIETADGYVWKYIYKVPTNSKFESLNYIPVPRTANVIGYTTNVGSTVVGGIYSIVLDDGGANYNTATVTAVAFSSATNLITLATLSGVSNGMFVSGNGIYSLGDGTHVLGKIGANQIRLSRDTISSGGGLPNPLSFTTRVTITGDGTGARALANVTSANVIDKISVSEYGSGYTFANVSIFGNGIDGSARAIMGPVDGHGYYPAEELAANSVMISVKIGEGDSTEGGLISDVITFRQYGFLRDPYKYGNTRPLNSLSSNNFVSQTHNITLVPGSNYTRNEIVYQGTSLANATFSGIVNDYTSSEVRLTNVLGIFTPGGSLTGVTSVVSRNGIKITYPELQPYTGDILYVENRSAVQRTTGQAENLRFVINF